MRISDWSSDVCSSDLDRIAYLVRDLTPALSAVRRLEHASAQSGIEGRRVLRISREAVDPAFVGKSVVRQAVPSTEAVGALDDTNVEPGVEPDKIGRASCRERVCQYV